MLQHNIKTKKCYHCKIGQPMENYSFNKSRKDGRAKHCRKCMQEFNRRSYANRTPEQIVRRLEYNLKYAEKEKERIAAWHRTSKGKKSQRKSQLKAKYNLRVEDYNQALLLQGQKCAICRKEFEGNLSIDHDHRTGRIRGLLCKKCNSVLGFVDDNVDILKAAIQYLTKEENNVTIADSRKVTA